VESRNGLTVGKVGWSESRKGGKLESRTVGKTDSWKVGKSDWLKSRNGWKVGMV